MKILSALRSFVFLFLFTSVILLWLFPAALMAIFLISPELRHHWMCWFWRYGMRFLFWFNVTSKYYYEDNRNLGTNYFPKGLLISNHLSNFDPFVMHSRIGCFGIMKQEIFVYPIFGFIAWISGGIGIDRSNSRSRRAGMKKALNRLKEGKGVFVYPEGTRSRSGEPKPFHEVNHSLVSRAHQLGRPVYPVSLYGTPSLALKKERRLVGIILHPEVLPEHFPQREDFVHECWSRVVEGYERLKKLDQEQFG